MVTWSCGMVRQVTDPARGVAYRVSPPGRCNGPFRLRGSCQAPRAAVDAPRMRQFFRG